MTDNRDGTRVGDWQCPNTACINHTGFPTQFVFGVKVNCPKCGTGKSAQKAGDWCCPNPGCVNHQNCVYGSKTQCNRCGAERPPLNARGGAVPNASLTMVGGGMDALVRQLGGRPMPRMGDWHCANPSCKNHTENLVYGSKPHCPVCGMEKPAPPPDMGPGPSPFGPTPQAQGRYPMVTPRPGVPAGRMGDWHCPNTSCKNHRDNTVYGSKSSCPICHTPKPDVPVNAIRPGAQPSQWGPYAQPPLPRQPSAGGPDGRRGQPGDWHCTNPDCKNHRDNVVFASKTSCPVCHTPKPTDASVTFAATSRPGDWQCPNSSCKNHINGVYARNPICSLCGESNPNLGLSGEARSRSRSPF